MRIIKETDNKGTIIVKLFVIVVIIAFTYLLLSNYSYGERMNNVCKNMEATGDGFLLQVMPELSEYMKEIKNNSGVGYIKFQLNNARYISYSIEEDPWVTCEIPIELCYRNEPSVDNSHFYNKYCYVGNTEFTIKKSEVDDWIKDKEAINTVSWK